MLQAGGTAAPPCQSPFPNLQLLLFIKGFCKQRTKEKNPFFGTISKLGALLWFDQYFMLAPGHGVCDTLAPSGSCSGGITSPSVNWWPCHDPACLPLRTHWARGFCGTEGWIKGSSVHQQSGFWDECTCRIRGDGIAY